MSEPNQLLLTSEQEFQEDSRAPIIEPNITDSSSTELWLIQWPKDQVPDFNGQQVSLNLRKDDGQLGSFEASSGKSYDIVSFGAEEPKSTVFLSSAEDSKIFGKITRRVSFVHYLEPSDVLKDDGKKLKQLKERSSSVTTSAYNFATPTRSMRPAPSSGRTTTHSSGRKSSLSEEKMRSKPTSSGQNSGHGSGHSEEKKAKKKRKDVA